MKFHLSAICQHILIFFPFSELLLKIKRLLCGQKRNQRKTMRKAITIPNIEEDIYAAIKKNAVEQNSSVSSIMNKIMKQYILGEKTEAEPVPNAEQSEELLAIKEENAQLEKIRQEQFQRIAELERQLREQNESAKTKINELEHQLVGTQEYAEQANAALDRYQKNDSEGVFVELPALEKKLIYHIAKKESERTGEAITPSLLLRAMFTNYCFKGETWFFPFPKKSEIRQLQAELASEKGTENE